MSLIRNLKAQQYATQKAFKKEEEKITQSLFEPVVEKPVVVETPKVIKMPEFIPPPDVPPVFSIPNEEPIVEEPTEMMASMEEENPLILQEDIPEEALPPSPAKDILLPSIPKKR